jgi:hypothetical protein
MEGGTPDPEPFRNVRRDFELSRLHGQLLALAYEQLLPIIRSPRRHPRRRTPQAPAAALAKATQGGAEA